MATDSSAPQAAKVRLPYYDNVKFFLIVCVVIGHIIKFGPMDTASEARGLGVFIYSYHMPLFIFLSGLFLKRERITFAGTFKRAAQYLALYALAKVLRRAVPFMLGQPVTIDWLNEAGLPWFMFALAAYYVLAWALQWCNFYVVGIAALVGALYAGNVPEIGDYLCLSRVIVFFPFFWLGHALDARRVTEHFAQEGPKVAGVALILLAGYVCFTHADALFGYRDLFLGRSCYALSPIPRCTWMNRLCGYAVSLALSYAILAIMPQGHVPLMSTYGTRTLQVYLLHYEVIELLWVYGVLDAVLNCDKYGWVLFIPLAVLIAVVLSIPKLPKLPKLQVPEMFKRATSAADGS